MLLVFVPLNTRVFNEVVVFMKCYSLMVRVHFIQHSPSSASPYRTASSPGTGNALARATGLPSSRGDGGGNFSSYSYKSKSVAWSDDVGGRDRKAEPTGGALRETMDEQRKAISMATDRLNRLRSKPGYYPLSEGEDLVVFFYCFFFLDFLKVFHLWSNCRGTVCVVCVCVLR